MILFSVLFLDKRVKLNINKVLVANENNNSVTSVLSKVMTKKIVTHCKSCIVLSSGEQTNAVAQSKEKTSNTRPVKKSGVQNEAFELDLKSQEESEKPSRAQPLPPIHRNDKSKSDR